MTDIKLSSKPQLEKDNIIELMELLFFAYRDFISDPDTILRDYGFGRAHHRVIHFVARNPGMSVADLLDILQITKQSLARVLKELIKAKFIVQKQGEKDRRQRLLYVTNKGHTLFIRLQMPQSRRISQALRGLKPDERKTAKRFLQLLLNENQ